MIRASIIAAILVTQPAPKLQGLQGIQAIQAGPGGGGLPAPVLEFNPGEALPSVDNLSRSLTINGTTVEPSVWCKADGAGSFTCEYGGGTFTENGSPADAPSALVGDRAVEFDGTSSLEIDDGAGMNFGTDDVYMMALVKKGDTATTWYVQASDNGAVGTDAFSLINISGSIRVDLNDTSTALVSTADTGGWTLVSYGADRDYANATYGARMSFNGVNVDTGDVSAESATSVAFDGVSFGSRPGNSFPLGAGARIAFFALWHAPDVFPGDATNATIMDTIAAEEFQKMVGVWPRIGGSAASTISRASSAYLRNYNATTGVTSLELVTDNWPRVERFLDANGDIVVGLTVEPAFTNIVLQSEDLSTTWSKVRAGDTVLTDQFATSTGETTMDCIEADGIEQSHLLEQSINVTDTTAYIGCAEMRAGDQTWGVLGINSGGGERLNVNLSTCSVGTTSGLDWSYAWDMGNGLCGACFGYTTAASAGNDKIALIAGEADDDITFAGDADGDADVCFGNVVFGPAEYVPTYVKTTTVAATRAADVLEHDLPSTLGEGSVTCDVVIPQGDNGNTISIFAISGPGTAGTDRVGMNIASNDGFLYRSVLGGVNEGQVVLYTDDFVDGAKHSFGMTWADNSFWGSADGALGTEDTAGTASDVDLVEWLYTASSVFPATYESCKVYNVPGEGLIQ